MEKKLVEQRVVRTRKLMEVGSKLREYRDRIDEVIKLLSSEGEFHSSVSREITEVGTGMQRLSIFLRPLSVENKKNARRRELTRAFENLVKKNKVEMTTEMFASWMSTYSQPSGQYSGSRDGPSLAFFKDYESYIGKE